MTTTQPLAADPDTWNDDWEPGIPLYDKDRFDALYQDEPLVTVVRDVPHDGDCTGTYCDHFFDSAFTWQVDPDAWYRQSIEEEYGPLTGPGTTFYGATIGVPS